MKAMKAKAAPKAMKMKAMKAKTTSRVMSKTGIYGALSTSTELKKKDVKAVLESLVGVTAKELKRAGKFTIPGITRINLKQKAATKAGKRMAFGKEITVKAKPACKVVKCY